MSRYITNTHKLYNLLVVVSAAFLVLFLPAVFITMQHASQVKADWYADGWAYRTRITFANGGSAVTYQKVKFDIDTATLISAGKMQADCGDSRFTDANGALLRYYIDSSGGACNTSSTDYYVLMPSIIAGTNLVYHYYGNPSAPNGTESSQFDAATFTQTPSTGSEEKGTAPVLYWPFSEKSGTTAHDTTSQQNDGTIASATWAGSDACHLGNCVDFDGYFSKVSKTYSSDKELDPGTGSFTVTAWFKHSSPISGTDFLISRFSGGGYKIGMDTDGTMCFMTDSDGTFSPSDAACTTETYNDSQWHYLAAVKNGTTSITLYIDGLEKATVTPITDTGSLSGSSPTFYVGMDSDGSSNPWDGYIDEVKYFNVAKTAAEIKGGYAATEGVFSEASAVYADPANANLVQGLVGWWKMDDSTWVGAGTVKDSSGNRNDGTIYGTPYLTQGKFGTGGAISGSNYISISDSANLRPNDGSWSMSIWAKPANVDQATVLVLKTSTSAGYEQYFMGFCGNEDCSSSGQHFTAALAEYVGTTGRTTMSSSDDVDGNWHLYTMVADKAKDKVLLYRDGELLSGTTYNYGSWPTVNNTDGLTIGNDGASINGTVDELRMYNRALSPSEVGQLYAWTPGPVAYYKADEGSGSTLHDLSGNSNDLTVSGGTTDSWAQGQYGYAMHFDRNASQYASMSDSASLSITGNLSLSAWIKPDAVTASTEYQIAGKSDGTNLSYLLVQYGDEIRLYLGSASVYVTTTDTNLTVGQWYHVEALYDAVNQTVEIYVNGVKQATSTSGTVPSSLTDQTNGFFLSNFEAGSAGTVNLQVGSGGDDGDTDTASDNENTLTRTPNLPVGSFNGNEHLVAAYFDPVNVPQGATITSAYFKPTGETTYDCGSCTLSANIYLDDSDDAATLTTTNMNDRTPTAHSATWDMSAISADQEYSIDVTSAVQDVVDRGSWASGHAMVVIFEDNASDYSEWQDFYSYEGSSSKAMKLSISYSTGDANFYDGTIDDVKVYNYVRTPQQVVSDMNAGHPAPGSPVGSPIGWWKFDEGYGDTAHNSGSAGSTLDGNLADSTTCPQTGDSACPTWTGNGKFGKALTFDTSGTTDDYVVMSSEGSTLSVSDYSISAWIYRTTDTGNIEQIVDNRDDVTHGWSLVIFTDDTIRCSHNGQNVNSTTTISTGKWYHVVCTRNSTNTTTTVYIDGKYENSGATSGTISESTNMTVGVRSYTPLTSYFPGRIDEVKVYNFALTDSQVKQEYNQGAAQVMGALSTESSAGVGDQNAANRAYCVPGDSATCDPPVGEWKFDENQGAAAYDTSGHGNSCSFSSMPANPWVTGKLGSALDFQKTDDVVTCSGGDSQMDNMGAMSVVAWVKPRTSSTYEQIVDKSSDAVPSDGWIFETDRNNNSLEFWVAASGSPIIRTANNVLLPNRWQQVAVTWTGSSTASNIKLYVNGREVPTYTTTTNGGTPVGDSAYDVTIGNDPTTGDDYDGYIDDVRIYDYVRTPAQIAWDYNHGRPVAWYKFDECQGTTAHDASGNGLDGTITPGGGTAPQNTAAGTCGSGNNYEMWNDGTDGKYSGSLGFDGNDDYVSVTDPGTGSKLDLTDFTLSVWFKANGLTGYHDLITKPGNGNYLLETYGDELSAGFYETSTSYELISTAANLQTGTWYHAVYTKSGSDSRIYLNGKEVASDTLTGTPNQDNSAVEIGAGYINEEFDGQIDDARIYNYPLTATQVQTLYNQGAVQFGQ